MTKNSVAAVVAAILTFHSAVVPAFAADRPYFRLNYGLGTPGANGGGGSNAGGNTGTGVDTGSGGGTGTGGTGSGGTQNPPVADTNTQAVKVVGGPSGNYRTRKDSDIVLPGASSTPTPVTWSLDGSVPSTMTVNPSSGVVTWHAGTIGTYGFAHLVATYQPVAGGDPMQGVGPDFGVVVLGQPFIAYAPPASISGGGNYVLTPVVENAIAPSFSLDRPVPAGLSFSTATGAVTVTPTATGTYPNLVVTLLDSDGVSQPSSPFTINVSTRSASVSVPSASGVQDIPFSDTISVSGLTAPVAYETISGSLPPGIQYCSNPDRLCGTPSAPGTYGGIVIRATGADGLSRSTNPDAPIVLTIAQPSLSYATQTVPVGTPFSISPNASNIDAATYAFQGATVPGVTVASATGVVSGSLSSTDPVTLVVAATNRYGTYASKPFVLTGKLDSFTVASSSSVVQAHVGYPVRQQFQASPADPKLTWTVETGTLPVGLALGSGTGLVSGAGTAPANVSGIVVRATNASGDHSSSAPGSYQIKALPSVANAAAYSAVVGTPFSVTLTGDNLIGTGSFTTDSSRLPPGLSLTSAGVLSGTPTAPGAYDNIVVSLADAYDGAAGQGQGFSIQVTPASTDLAVTGIPAQYKVRQANVLTTQQPTVVNALSGVTWSLAPGSASLPDGMSLDPATGIISGTASSPGDTANIILQATETGTKSGSLDVRPRVRLATAGDSWMTMAAGTTTRRSAVSRPFTVTVAPKLAVTNVNPTYALKIASAVSVNPQASGVLGSTTWRLSGATLPQALGFDVGTGRIAGPALAAGRVPDPAPAAMTLTAVDSFDGATAASTPFSFQVDPGLVVVGATRFEARAGSPYASGVAFTAANAQGTISWNVVGNLPAGLRVNAATGEISGSPTTPGSTPDLRMQAVQNDGQTGVSAPFTFVVRGGLDVSVNAYNIAHVNRPMAAIVPSVAGSVGNVTWSIASGSLPPGLAMDTTTGAIRGTPTATGIFHNILLAAADPTGNSGVSGEVVIEVNNNMSWAATVNFPPGRRGARLSMNAPKIAGASLPISYKIVSNYADWTVDQSTGVITGAATTGYIWDTWFVATDATGATLSHPTILTPISKPFEYPGNSSMSGFVGSGMVSNPGYTFEAQGMIAWTKEGTWPDWVTLDPRNGYASGTPPAEGTYTFTTRATDTFDNTGGTFNRTFYVSRYPSPDPNHQAFTFRSPNSYTFVDPFITPPDSVPGTLTWTMPGNLPYGLGFHANGRNVVLDRYYTEPGFYPNMTFSATSDQGGTFSVVYDITVYPRLGVDLGGQQVCAYSGDVLSTPVAKFSGLQGTASLVLNDFYDTPLPYTNGSWPSWLSLDPSTGVLSGTVPADDTATFSLRYGAKATDSADGAVGYTPGYSYLSTYRTLDFDLPPQFASGYVSRLPDGYSYYDRQTQLRFHGVNGDWYYRITNGALPEGMYLLNSDQGAIYGTPIDTVAKDYPFTLTLFARQCGVMKSVSKDVILKVKTRDPEKFIVNPTTVYARANIPFRSAPVPYIANKGTENWTFDQRNGGRPPGMAFDPGSGAFYGTPTQTWNDSYRLQAWSDQGGYTLGTWSGLVVTPGPSITMTDASVTQGVPASVAPNASGFAGPVTWTYSGTLPPGMSFDPGVGAVIGTATASGSFGPITFTGTEQTLPQVGPSDPQPAYPSATSNGFNIVVTGGAAITGLSDQTRVIGQSFQLNPQVTGLSGTVQWGQGGDLPAGVSLDKGTGIISGIGTAYGSRTLTIQATDASGNSATSGKFTLKVTDADGNVPTNGPATWTWGAQVCTYSCSGGVCKGRQKQNCNGTGCEAVVRGCDAPYQGGDTSFPVGNLATSCDSPSNDPNEMFCPTPPPAAPAVWMYRMYMLQTQHTHGFVVNHYTLTCYDGATIVDASRCPAAPTTVTDCGINGYGVGYCASNVPTQDGVKQTSFGGPAGWYD